MSFNVHVSNLIMIILALVIFSSIFYTICDGN